MFIDGVYQSNKIDFRKIKTQFFRQMAGTFSAYVSCESDIGYADNVLNIFLKLKFHYQDTLDFEFDLDDFKIFKFYDFSEDDWMKIYSLFSEVFKRNNKLNPFIRLFLYDLIYAGPFEEDIEALDMSEELLALMDDDMLRLYDLFDEYFNSDDSSLVSDIVEASKAPTIPAFVVIHLADWINDHTSKDKSELGDLIIELYLIAVDKILKKPLFSFDNKCDIGGIRYEIDTSNFSDEQIEKFYMQLRKKFN